MDEKLLKLSTLGAGEIEHLDGPFIDHLVGTREILKSWGASEVLQDAGLYHAAYGTAGFGEKFSSSERRQEIAEIIGEAPEEIVYLYCACDRDYFWPQIGVNEPPEFKNRFTGEHSYLSEQQLRDFCELTVANELEIATDNPAFIEKNGEHFFETFERMQPYLSAHAIRAYKSLLG